MKEFRIEGLVTVQFKNVEDLNVSNNEANVSFMVFSAAPQMGLHPCLPTAAKHLIKVKYFKSYVFQERDLSTCLNPKKRWTKSSLLWLDCGLCFFIGCKRECQIGVAVLEGQRTYLHQANFGCLKEHCPEF